MTKKVNIFLTICIIFSVIYILAAVRPLGKELHFTTEWTTDCTRQTSGEYDPGKIIPFKLGQQAGYFTADGQIASTISFPYKAAISQFRYATYGTNSSSIQLFAPDGTLTGTINSSGFPFFQDDRMYIMHSGGASFSRLSEDGSIKWTYENYVPLTAFASSPAGTAAGYADGTILIFSPDGIIDQTIVPGGSRYSVILGTAISDSGKFVAGICGQAQQRFFLASRTDGFTKIIFHKYLDNASTRQLLVKFNRNEDTVYFDTEDGLGILNIKTMKHTSIPIKGHILSIQESDTENTVFVLSRNGETCTVSVIEPFAKYAGSFSFKAQHSFMTVDAENLFIGRDSSITKIKIEHK